MNDVVSALHDQPESNEIENPIKMLRIYDLEHGVGYNKSTINLESNTDLLSYLITLSQETMKSQSSRSYTFDDDSFVLEQLATIDNDIDLHARNIADHLFFAEDQSRFKTSNGSFIIAKLQTNNRYCYLLTKLDFKKYFEEHTYKLKAGLPHEKGLLKSCLININVNEIFEKNIYLADKNGRISAFWHTDFLKSTPVRNNETNTEEVFTVIQRLLRTKVKKVSENDYLLLKDCVVGYFNTKEIFDFDDFIADTITAYTPITDDFTVEEFVHSLKSEKERLKFDGSFEIDKTYVKKKIKEVIDVNDGVKLVIQGSTNDIVYEVSYENKEYILIENNSRTGRFERKELD